MYIPVKSHTIYNYLRLQTNKKTQTNRKIKLPLPLSNQHSRNPILPHHTVSASGKQMFHIETEIIDWVTIRSSELVQRTGDI